MRQMTEQNMITAFGGESVAHMRYRLLAQQAGKDGHGNAARFPRAIAEAEFTHAGDHYRELRHLDAGLVAKSMGALVPGDTPKNLGLAIAGETYEITDMYPAFRAVATLQEEKGAWRSFDCSCETEKMHKAPFQKAKEAVDRGQRCEPGNRRRLLSVRPRPGRRSAGQVPRVQGLEGQVHRLWRLCQEKRPTGAGHPGGTRSSGGVS